MPESAGIVLKKIRESKRLIIEEVSERSRIPKATLSAIEEDRINEIKPSFYAKSFVRTYAAFLGALNEPAIKEYLAGASQQQKKLELISKPGPATLNKPGSEKKAPTGKAKDIDFSFAAQYRYHVAAIVAGILVFWMLSAAIGGVSKFIKNAHAKKQDKQAVVKKAPAKKEERSAEKQIPKEAVKEKKEEPVSEKREYIELEVTASDNNWLQVVTDGDLIFTGAFKKGSKDTWKAKKEIRLEAGNSGGIKISINGKPAIFSGKKGEKKDFIITKDGIKN